MAAKAPRKLVGEKFDTREAWIVACTKLLDKDFFSGKGYTLPPRNCMIGVPYTAPSTAIGQCWDKAASKDGKTFPIFVCPSLGEDPVLLVGTLLHEMLHASVGLKAGHRGPFKKLWKEFGYVGKTTQVSVEPPSELWFKLSQIASQCGRYPHIPFLKRGRKLRKNEPWVRYQSENDEEYKVAVLDSIVETHGAPLDPWGDEMKRCKSKED